MALGKSLRKETLKTPMLQGENAPLLGERETVVDPKEKITPLPYTVVVVRLAWRSKGTPKFPTAARGIQGTAARVFEKRLLNLQESNTYHTGSFQKLPQQKIPNSKI